MLLDLLVIGWLTFFAILGALSGALAQGARLLAATGAGLLSRPAGGLLAPLLQEAIGLPRALASPVAIAISGVALYLLLATLGRALARGFTRDRERRSLDRGAGALFGAMQAAVIAWIALSALVGLEGRFGLGWDRSLAASLAKDRSFFSAVRQLEARP